MKLFHFLILGLSSLLFFGCSRDGDFRPGKRIVLTVMDNEGQLIENAKVWLYRTQEDLRNDISPIQPMQLTDKMGRTTFFITETIDYMVVCVEKDDLNNWYRRNDIYIENPQETKQTVVVESSLRSQLAGKNGKKWLQTSFFFDGRKLESCVYRRTFDFIYNGTIDIYESSECGGGSVGTNVWQLIEDDTKIRWGVPNGRDDKFIESLTEDELILTYKYGGRIPTREVYQAVD
ncbi:MAG: hypothetical protein EAZ57_07545 [Cytophagales bacterium]|nr:MAG: hypothetical protein EAZ67_08630 [Cytophagales bacterium]TAF60391.1 MAG: hypothetical protein EAZ57_07545 [Cytophagales bacterium]